jgi:hypothetical protein
MQNGSDRWEKYQLSYDLLISYINSKREDRKYELDIVDLMYVRNFKGGSASINEDEEKLKKKLIKYSILIKSISEMYLTESLFDLSEDQMQKLKNIAVKFIYLSKEEETKIKGFGPSFTSALLHAHFPKLLPIIDRRVINGTGLKKVKRKQQVTNSEKYYGKVVEIFWNRVHKSKESIRDVDKYFFSEPLK